MASKSFLRIARYKSYCRVLGPGNRAVIWFHGCSLACSGCIANEMNRSQTFESFTPLELAQRVSNEKGIDGITLSGGDPFDQDLNAFLQFLRIVRKTTNLSIMCYTGRYLEQLLRSDEGKIYRQILQYIDLLVDGPYIDQKNDGLLWRGSSNQRFYSFTGRHKQELAQWMNTLGTELEIELIETRLEITGIPNTGFLSRFKQSMSAQAVHYDEAMPEGRGL